MLVLSVGCYRPATFTTGYEVDSVQFLDTPVPATLAIGKFEDHRPDRLSTVRSKIWMTYIPLLPYVNFPFERFDESIKLKGEALGRSRRLLHRNEPPAPKFEQYAYSLSFPRAIAQDLNGSGIFRKVVYEREHSGSHRYLLEGTIRETPYYYYTAPR